MAQTVVLCNVIIETSRWQWWEAIEDWVIHPIFLNIIEELDCFIARIISTWSHSHCPLLLWRMMSLILSKFQTRHDLHHETKFQWWLSWSPSLNFNISQHNNKQHCSPFQLSHALSSAKWILNSQNFTIWGTVAYQYCTPNLATQSVAQNLSLLKVLTDSCLTEVYEARDK